MLVFWSVVRASLLALKTISDRYSIFYETTSKEACRTFLHFYTASLVAVNSTETDTGDMVFVLGGQFSLDERNYNVILSSFYMAKYEVTQAKWASVMTGNVNNISAMPSHTSYGIGDTNPVNQVTWYNILVYCNRRSIQEGLMPVYAKAGDTNPDNWGNVPISNNVEWNVIEMNMSATGYRMPTIVQFLIVTTTVPTTKPQRGEIFVTPCVSSATKSQLNKSSRGAT